MPYLSKLTKRLAMSLCLIVAAACSDAAGDLATGPSSQTTGAADARSYRNRVARVTLSPDSAVLAPGQTFSFVAQTYNSRGSLLTGRTISWTSDLASIARVDSVGSVTAIAAGRVLIRAQSEGVVDSATIIVEPAPTLPLPVTPDAVTDLRVTSLSSETVTLTFTEVEYGPLQPANYAAAIAATSIDWATVSATFLPGISIGSQRSVSFSNLTPGATYRVQLAVIPGALTDTTTLDHLSNIATFQAPVATSGTSFFGDNFDSGARLASNGFTWSSTGSRVVVSSERAFSGTHSLRFRYGPDTLGQDSSAEQRFNFGRNLTEVWVEYMLYVPTNYSHRSDSPSNNKFIRIWGDEYASANKVGASTLPVSGGSSSLGFEYNYKTWGDGTLGFGPASVAGAQSTKATFGNDAMRGRWTQVRLHFRNVSGADRDDGHMQIWLDGVLAIDFRNVPQKYDAAKPYWNQGYLFGWSNSGFTSETIFFIDDVKFFSSNPGW